MNKLASIAIIILLFCGGALWYFASGSLNLFIKEQIEQQGSAYTGQQVSVGQVDIKLTQGAGSISGLSLANPATYQQKNAFSMENVTLDINVKSLTEEPIIIDEIAIIAPQAFVEVSKTGSSNFNEILDELERNLPKSEQAPQPAGEEPAQNKQEPKIRVEKIVVSGVALTLDLSQLGNKAHQVTLPEINLTKVGGEQGLPANQLGGEIIKQVLKKISKAAKEEQKQKIKDKITDKIKDKLSDLFK
ncbi:AsmA family protein [Thalassomonas viridans]|uniref:AsmA family protein n=1 Tax=Thalassomonas viridans TaxID=137584 RepID=A0AAF0C7X1_9GAMM|nr:AsmA family protein [Thalassomonas viridans]WDE04138.1 AsmA family protein [Thalassomonas viridans]